MKTTTALLMTTAFTLATATTFAGPGPICLAEVEALPAQCHLDIVEVQASEIAPDLGYGGFWIEDYKPGSGFDGQVKVGACNGRCVSSTVGADNLRCIPTDHKPVRIENHSYKGVTVVHVWVPSACGCGTGPDIDYLYLNPALDDVLDTLLDGLLDSGDTSGPGLGAVLAGVPGLDPAAASAVGRRIVDGVTPVFALMGAPANLDDANAGVIPFTPALKGELEAWLWSHLHDAVQSAVDAAGLAPPLRTAVRQALARAYPALFAG